MKDLLRKIHLKKPDAIHDEPGTVNFHTLYGYYYYSCSINSEKAAKKIFSMYTKAVSLTNQVLTLR